MPDASPATQPADAPPPPGVCPKSESDRREGGGGHKNFLHPGGLPPFVSDAAEALARRFHETYERLAPSFGYETRKASAVPWAEVPENNKALMVAVCAELLTFAANR